MAQFNGTAGNDNFLNTPGSDTYVGMAGDDTLNFTFGTGQDLFYGGTTTQAMGTDLLNFGGGLFYVSYMMDTWYDYGNQDFDFGRKVMLSDGTSVSVVNRFYPGWQQFKASDTSALTQLFAGQGNTVTAMAGGNWLIGGADHSQAMYGNIGNDVIFANGGSDTVYGGDGADYISAGKEDGSNDTFDGGAGNDIVSYSGAGAVTINLASGYAYGPGIGLDRLISIEQGVGSQSNDVLIGSLDANTFWGLFGNDYVYAGEGNDIAYGGAGIDVLLGEGGNDSLYGDEGQDYLFGGEGSDTLHGGLDVDVLIGGAGDDLMYGGQAGDIAGDYFYGEAGNDTAWGASGNDIFILGEGNDEAHGGEGQDYFYMGDGNDKAFGGAGVDVLLGEAGNDTLNGGAGVNYYFGGAGADQFAVSSDTAAVLQDFARGEGDRIVLLGEKWSATGFAGLLARAHDAGSYTILYSEDFSTSVWVIGQTAGTLQDTDFLFV